MYRQKRASDVRIQTADTSAAACDMTGELLCHCCSTSSARAYGRYFSKTSGVRPLVHHVKTSFSVASETSDPQCIRIFLPAVSGLEQMEEEVVDRMETRRKIRHDEENFASSHARISADERKEKERKKTLLQSSAPHERPVKCAFTSR